MSIIYKFNFCVFVDKLSGHILETYFMLILDRFIKNDVLWENQRPRNSVFEVY